MSKSLVTFLFNLKKINCFQVSIVMSLIYLLMLNFTPNIFGLLQPDSEGYINFSSIRSSIYPILLKFFDLISLNILHIVLFQKLMFSVSIFFLFYTLLVYQFNIFFIIALYLSLFLNFYFNGFHHVILTESLSFSIIIFFLGNFISYVLGQNKKHLFYSILSLSILFCIKPSAISILLAGIICCLIIFLIYEKASFSKNKYVILSCIILPLMTPIAIENISFYSFHDKRDSVLPIHFHGKSIIINIFNNTEDLQSNKHFNGDIKTINFVKEAKVYLNKLEESNYKCLFYERVGDFENYAYFNLNSQNYEYIKESISRNVFNYFKLTAIHYLNFFCVASQTIYSNYIDEPPIISDDFFGEKYRVKIINILFLILGAIFFISSIFYSILFLIFKQKVLINKFQFINPSLIIMCHSYFILTSILSISNPRYLMLVYPILIFICLQFFVDCFYILLKRLNNY